MTAAQELAAAVLAASSSDDARAALERGEVSAELATAARRFAARTAQAERWPRGITPALERYRAAAVVLAAAAAATGDTPTIDQLAAATGRSRTAAHAAAVRLRRLGLWPGSAASDKTPHPDATGPV